MIICENGIVHRLTQPATLTTTGKVERPRTLRRELLDDVLHNPTQQPAADPELKADRPCEASNET